MTIRPLRDRIVVRRHDEGERKVSGIIVPESAKKEPQRGKVITAGHGKFKDDGKRVPLDVKVGAWASDLTTRRSKQRQP